MKKQLLLLTLLCLNFCVYAQNLQINGSIIDSTANINLKNTSIVLLNAKDSILIADTRTNANGQFTLSNLKPGNYILMVTYPKYVDYVAQISLNATTQNLVLPKINMFTPAILLKDVIVTAKKAAITLRGDTTEYNAGSYVVQPNAPVEDLLKQLPGLQVDGYGKITAQGKTVTKVLVDGEEFFGNDPTLVTKNLRADMIDKVQVFDKKSEQAVFTGIDDGKKDKTINLKLKEDKKLGYFGKLNGGLASNNFYQTEAMFNWFKKDEKLAVYGSANNIGSIGLGYEDREIYSNGNDNINLVGKELDTWNGDYNGQGIPVSKSGGVHYNNKWNDGKQNLNTNYNINDFNVKGEINKQVQQNLPTSVLITQSQQNFDNSLLNHTSNAKFKLQVDTLNSIEVNLKAGVVQKNTFNIFSTQTNNQTNILNSNDRSFSTKTNNEVFSGDLLWSKKFKKDRRTLSLSLNQYFNNSNSTGLLRSTSVLFISNVANQNLIINQDKANINNAIVFNSKAVYTEPITKSASLFVNYGIGFNNESLRRNTFNILPSGINGPLDSLFSNSYNFNQLINRGGLGYNYTKGKLRLQLANDLSNTAFKQKNLFNNTTLNRNFVFWHPSTELVYNFSAYKNLEIRYNGNTQQPNMDQIQPILNNTDPLNIFVGNANLSPAFTNSASVNFNSFKVLTDTYFATYADINITNNPITTAVQTDIDGKNTFTYFNLSGKNNLSYNGNMFYSVKTKFWDIYTGFNAQFNGNQFQSISNGQTNTANSSNYNFKFDFTKQKNKVYVFNIQTGTVYNRNTNNLQPLSNNNSWGFTLNHYIDIFLPKKFQFKTDGNYLWQGKTQTFNQNFSRYIINASIGRTVNKAESLTFKISVNDLLNQNIGFDRSSFNNAVTQNSYTTIRRYVMLNAAWTFNSFKPKTLIEKNNEKSK